jgi:hypothetical protein
VRECRTPGSVRGVPGNWHPYRDRSDRGCGRSNWEDCGHKVLCAQTTHSEPFGNFSLPTQPTWQAFTLEQVRWVFENIIRPHCAIWVATRDERVVAYLGTIDALRQRCDSLSTLGIGSVAESQGAAPLRQLELTPPGAAEFVICDHTIENENNNVLKTKGYHIEHNFGHGKQYLSAFLLNLSLLAFLFRRVIERKLVTS